MSELENLYKMMLTEYPDILSVAQAAKILGCEDHRVYKMIDEGCFYATKPGKSYRISKYSLLKYLHGDKSA